MQFPTVCDYMFGAHLLSDSEIGRDGRELQDVHHAPEQQLETVAKDAQLKKPSEVTFLGKQYLLAEFGQVVNASLRTNEIAYRDLVQTHREALARILMTETDDGNLVNSLEKLLPAVVPGDSSVPYHVAIKLVLLDSDTGKLRLKEIYQKLEEKWPALEEKKKTYRGSVRNILSRYKAFRKDWDDNKYWRLNFAEDPIATRYKDKSRTKPRSTKAKSLSPSPTLNNVNSTEASAAEDSARHCATSEDVQGLWEGNSHSHHAIPPGQSTLHSYHETPPPPPNQSPWATEYVIPGPLMDVPPSRILDSDSSTMYFPGFDQVNQLGEWGESVGGVSAQRSEGGIYTQLEGPIEGCVSQSTNALRTHAYHSNPRPF